MSEPSGRHAPRDVREALRALRRRPTRAEAVIAVLCGLLAFGLVTQVHQTSRSGGLSSATNEDLVGILTDLDTRADRLRTEIGVLQQEQAALSTGGGHAAVQAARQRADQLGILAGTLPATGPGIVLTINDPSAAVRASEVLEAVEDLRDAGAEAMQIGEVRVVASTAVVDDPSGGIDVDGVRLSPPYRIAVIGDAHTLATALEIPGGVVDTVAQSGTATATVTSPSTVSVTALHRG